MSAEEAHKAFGSMIIVDGNRISPPNLPHEIVINNMFGWHAHFYQIAGGCIFAIVDAEAGVLVDYGAADSRSGAERELLYLLAEMWHELTSVEDDAGKIVMAYDPPEILSVQEFLEIMEHIYEADRPESPPDKPES